MVATLKALLSLATLLAPVLCTDESYVLKLTQDTFAAAVADDSKSVLVEFFAPW